jgi:hypothetical protein
VCAIWGVCAGEEKETRDGHYIYTTVGAFHAFRPLECGNQHEVKCRCAALCCARFLLQLCATLCNRHEVACCARCVLLCTMLCSAARAALRLAAPL